MVDIHFIEDQTTLNIISIITALAGPNFNPPYDSSGQPSDATARAEEALTQFDVPGGTSISGTPNPAAAPNMASVISSLLTAIGPIISAYGLILPILGVIRGIIEILCCLMNPFCVIGAVIRLFSKWIPPFISLFPPIAGVIIILNIIKLILAIILFVMTELIPTIALIIMNVETIIDAIDADNKAQKDAGIQKVLAVLIDLLNRIGILKIARPIIEIVFSILSLVAGFPCGGGKISGDTICCNDDQCPPEIRSPPHGMGLLVPKFYGDAPPLWTWKLYPITGHENIPKLLPYTQDLKSQLDPQLDEEVDEARPVGSKYDAAHFRLRILGRRGEKFCKAALSDDEPAGSKLVPIAKMSSDGYITATNVNLIQYMGVVDYCIEPNYDQLVGKNILSLGCHPEVEQVKNGLKSRFDDLEVSVAERYPELSEIPDLYDGLVDGLDDGLGRIRGLIEDENYDTGAITDIRDELYNLLLDTYNQMVGKINVILSRATDRISTTFEVDKNIANAGGLDKVIVSVIPRDAGGTAIARNLPDGVDISVELFTDFGVIQNQTINNSTGAVTAELISVFPGTATVTAKINTDFIMDFNGTEETLRTERVRFVADAVMPKRRVGL